MVRRPCLPLFALVLVGALVCGCPKRVMKLPSVEAPPARNPMAVLLEAYSGIEAFQSNASVRIEAMRKGGVETYLLNGFILYQKPDKLRILGYHPMGMGLFDALYVKGDFFVLSVLQKRAYTGNVSEFEDLMERTSIRISAEKLGETPVPNMIRVSLDERRARVEIRLKEITIESSLPADSFDWEVPAGVEVRPLKALLRGKNPSSM